MSISQKVLPFVIFSLPLQLNKYFFISSSLVFGIPIDYRAPAIYLSDIFIVIYIIAFLFEARNVKGTYSRQKNFILPLIVLNACFFAVNLLSQEQKLQPIYFSAKLLEFSLFSLALSIHFAKPSVASLIKKYLAITALLEASIIGIQFLLQKSLGLWFLGERTFDSTTPSIAHAYVFENQLLRAYGTFPHPNVAACFILVVQIIFLSKNINTKYALSKFEKFFLSITAIALIFTFSKIAILLEIILLAFIFRKTKMMIPLITIPAVIFIRSITQTAFVYSLSERIALIQASLNIAMQNLFFGIGSLNFITKLAEENIITSGEVRLLQPVHNVFFLILSENGLLGILVFLGVLFFVQKNIASSSKAYLFTLVLLYLSVDHFLWTLQQGQIILFLSIGYLVALTKGNSA